MGGTVERPAGDEGFKRSGPAQPETVGDLRREVGRYAATLGADETARSAITLAVSEAVTNAVVHAYVGNEPGRVSVQAWGDEHRHLFVQVCDEGQGMVPRIDSPGLGFGLSVMAQMADDLHVASGDGLGGTVVSMRFSLDASAAHMPSGETAA